MNSGQPSKIHLQMFAVRTSSVLVLIIILLSLGGRHWVVCVSVWVAQRQYLHLVLTIHNFPSFIIFLSLDWYAWRVFVFSTSLSSSPLLCLLFSFYPDYLTRNSHTHGRTHDPVLFVRHRMRTAERENQRLVPAHIHTLTGPCIRRSGAIRFEAILPHSNSDFRCCIRSTGWASTDSHVGFYIHLILWYRKYTQLRHGRVARSLHSMCWLFSLHFSCRVRQCVCVWVCVCARVGQSKARRHSIQFSLIDGNFVRKYICNL